MSPISLSSLPSLQSLLDQHQIVPKKSLGQNFLFDLNLTRKIVSFAEITPDTRVLEIGPGPGGLTRALLESKAHSVTALEKDSRFLPILFELRSQCPDRLTVIHTDALTFPYAEILVEPTTIVANLPYQIGTPLLLKWLRMADRLKGMTLMFQEEVADRITAEPGTRSYGRLSVISQYCCHVKKIMTIPARAFVPPPTIDSAVVQFTPHSQRPKDSVLVDLERVTEAAFGQRRKMLRSSLKAIGGEHLLESAKIDPTRRAETLTVDEFVRLTEVYRLQKSSVPT